jgi:hypothetical protein
MKKNEIIKKRNIEIIEKKTEDENEIDSSSENNDITDEN